MAMSWGSMARKCLAVGTSKSLGSDNWYHNQQSLKISVHRSFRLINWSKAAMNNGVEKSDK